MTLSNDLRTLRFCVEKDVIITGMVSPTLSGATSDDDMTGVKSFYEYTTFLHHQTTEDLDGNNLKSQNMNETTSSRSRRSSTKSCRNSQQSLEQMSTIQTPSTKSSDTNGKSREVYEALAEIFSRNVTASPESEPLSTSQESEEMSPGM